jgi:hypothetical protein
MVIAILHVLEEVILVLLVIINIIAISVIATANLDVAIPVIILLLDRHSILVFLVFLFVPLMLVFFLAPSARPVDDDDPSQARFPGEPQCRRGLGGLTLSGHPATTPPSSAFRRPISASKRDQRVPKPSTLPYGLMATSMRTSRAARRNGN